MTRAKRPLLALIISLILLMAVGVAVWQLPPQSWFIETGVVLAATLGLWLASSWITGQRKSALLTVVFMIVTLLLNRWGILDWITLGLWIAVVGLISLIN